MITLDTIVGANLDTYRDETVGGYPLVGDDLREMWELRRVNYTLDDDLKEFAMAGSQSKEPINESPLIRELIAHTVLSRFISDQRKYPIVIREGFDNTVGKILDLNAEEADIFEIGYFIKGGLAADYRPGDPLEAVRILVETLPKMTDQPFGKIQSVLKAIRQFDPMSWGFDEENQSIKDMLHERGYDDVSKQFENKWYASAHVAFSGKRNKRKILERVNKLEVTKSWGGVDKVVRRIIVSEIASAHDAKNKFGINPEMRDFYSVLEENGDLKRMIYQNDQETVRAMQDAGIIFERFMNLTDPAVVRQGIETLVTTPALCGRAGYNHAATRLRQKRLNIKSLSSEDVNIYADEIAQILLEAGKKDKAVKEQISDLERHVQSVTYSPGNERVSFQFATRDKQDIRLGDKCGDCSATDGVNSNWVEGWISDVNTQFLKLNYDNKFMGRFNLVLGRSGDDPTLLIDAIEFVPQARESNDYSARAKEAFSRGIEKVKTIARELGVTRVYANPFSNSSEVHSLLYEKYPSETIDFHTVREKPLNEVIGIERAITYSLQSRDNIEEYAINPRQIANFEHFMNTAYLTDEKQRAEVTKLAREGNIRQIGYKVSEMLRAHVESLEYNPFPIAFNIEEALAYLYEGSDSISSGGNFYRIE